MTPVERGARQLSLDGVPLHHLATTFGTPLYVYSERQIARRWCDFHHALQGVEHKICYAVKANSNPHIVGVLARLGSGFDIVSGGELAVVLGARGKACDIIFSGVGKREDEIEAALQAGVGCLNVESPSELLRIADVAARTGRQAPIAVRVNPDVDAQTHPYISTGLRENKFGVEPEQALDLYRQAVHLNGVNVTGIACHIGSQLTTIAPFVDAAARIVGLAERLRSENIVLQHVDLGGGLGIAYDDHRPTPSITHYVQALRRVVPPTLAIHLEPGRAIVADAGLLLTRVEYIKHNGSKHFAIVDAAMTDLLRPALYSAYHHIEAVEDRASQRRTYDVVGPVCETSDFLGRERLLGIAEGDLLCIHSTGAYGFSQASNYNSRPLPAEILVSDGQYRLIRRRQKVAELLATGVAVPQ